MVELVYGTISYGTYIWLPQKIVNKQTIYLYVPLFACDSPYGIVTMYYFL